MPVLRKGAKVTIKYAGEKGRIPGEVIQVFRDPGVAYIACCPASGPHAPDGELVVRRLNQIRLERCCLAAHLTNIDIERQRPEASENRVSTVGTRGKFK